MAQDLCFSEEMTILIWYCLYDVKEEIRVTLYELTEEYLKLLDTKKAIDESKVETDIKTAIQKKLIKKMESYLKVRQTLNAEIKALMEEEKRIQNRRKELEKRSNTIDNAVKSSMLATGVLKIKTTLFSFYIKPAEDVLVVDNESEIPERFFVAQEPKLNKKDLNKWAKNNPDKVAAFGHYEPVNSLIIK